MTISFRLGTCRVKLIWYLFNTQVCMAGCNCFTIIMRQRVEHRMVRVNRRQPIAFQLLANDVNQSFHSCIVVGPVTDDLQTMGQIAVSIGKIRFQFQGCPI